MALLHAHPWRPGAEPPPAAPPTAAALPELLLVDRREPLEPPVAAALLACLSPDERQRREAFRRPADRERFLLGRAGLRHRLGAWLQLPPAAVPLQPGPHGKPHCPGGPEFNLSHSGDLVLLAFHAGRAVGVDVERNRPGLDWRPIARRSLPAERRQRLESLAATAQPRAFLLEWCRLEADLKALGTGLAGLEALAANPPPHDRWDLALPGDHLGAVALAAGPDLRDHPAAAAAPRRGSRPE